MATLKKKKTKKKTETKKKTSVEDELESLSKELELIIMDEDSEYDIPYYIPFRHTGLQYMTGGVPGGLFTVIDGDSQCGKSYLLYELGIECQKMGGYFLLHDVERAFNPKFGKRVGLQKGMKFYISKEKTLEKMFANYRKFIRTIRKKNKTCPILIGCDSYPPLQIHVSQKEIDEQKGEKELKGYIQAKKNNILSQLLGEFITFIEEYDATFVLLNQAREKIRI